MQATKQTAPNGPLASTTARLSPGWETFVEDKWKSDDGLRAPWYRDGLKVLPLLLLLAAAGCAGHDPAPPVAEVETGDPAESVNRTVFGANQFADRNVLRPVARAYREHIPQSVRRSAGNFAGNLGEPRTLVNDLLQGNTTRAWNTTQRFAVNTTIGGAGLFDVATGFGLPRHSADFGQTLGVWGVGPGPATQLPLLGHSNLRDTVGSVAGFVGNPLSYIPGIGPVLTVGSGVGMMDARARVLPQTDALEASSLDYYAALRSARAQNREAVIEEGRQGLLRHPRIAGEP